MLEIFSVIVLLYNNSEFLEECLDSVLNQDYHSIEIIVVDDGSKLFDKKLVESYIERHKKSNIKNYLVYQNVQNLGTVKSANGAIKKTKGEFIKLLAADDALYDYHSLSHAARALTKSYDGIITSDVMKCDSQLNPISKYKKRLQEKVNTLTSDQVFRRLCVHNDIVAGGVFFSRTFFSQYGYFDESFRLIEDWPTWLEATNKGCKFYYEAFYAIKYRTNGGVGTSTNPIYLKDKKKVLDNIIVPSREKLGFAWYFLARVSFCLVNSSSVRRMYSLLFRENKKQ